MRFELKAIGPGGGVEAIDFQAPDEATARLNRVPAGFMRDMTREEVERVAASKNLTLIDLAVAEEGIGHARETMNEVISGYISQKKPR